MSSSVSINWERAQRRRELYEERIRANVNEHLARYREVMEDMRRQGLDSVVRETFDHAEVCMTQAQEMLYSDVEQSRAFSLELGDLLRGLPSFARAKKRSDAAADREAARREAIAEELRREHAQLSAEAEKARGEAAEALKKLVARIDETISNQSTQQDSKAAEETLKSVEASADEIAVDEALRKETIQALSATMRKLGFSGVTPVHQDKWIRVSFQNTVGEKALFLIGGDGAMKYSFSGYRGAACKKDRDRVCAQLEDVYGVKFSNKVIIHENPDDVEMTAVDAERPENAG